MNNKSLFLSVILLILLASCSTPKNVAYFQDAEGYKSVKGSNKYEAYIHKNDILSIIVNSHIAEAAMPFNLPMANHYVGGESYGQQRILGYHVDKEGHIDFPILGKIHVEGRTRNNLRELIKEMLIAESLLKDPVVTVNFLNFNVSVLGEVNRPGNFNITGERITLLEALSMAGDLTIYGDRERVLVVREVDGKSEFVNHNLLSTDIVNSPCYYLQQNDVIYVEQNDRRKQQSNINQNNSASVWLSVVSVLLTATSVIINLSK